MDLDIEKALIEERKILVTLRQQYKSFLQIIETKIEDIEKKLCQK